MISRKYFAALGAMAGLAASASTLSAAESYCVSCSGPQARYVCEVTLPDGVLPSQSPQLYCAYRLAADGGHASCSSRRSGETPCDGDYRQLTYQGSSLAAPQAAAAETPVIGAPAPTQAVPDPVETNEGAAGTAAEEQTGEPGTIAELTKQVSEAIGGGTEADDATAKDEARIVDEISEDAAAPAAEPERSTGAKIASAAKTALTCLTSLFEECQ